jgi:D-3-phosphoglycerate dehydrogenase
MDSGKLLGAAFDVFETEPVIPEAYRKYDNITITNHLGGLTINSYSDAPGYAIKNYLNYINGKADLAFFVNRNHLA